MLFLKLVIAHLVGVKTRFTDKLVRLMQTVGLVRQEHTQPHGNNLSVQDTKLQPQPAQSRPKRSSKVVPQTTQVVSLKPIQKPVRIKLGQDGSQRAILVPSTHPLAKSAVKRKPKAVKSIKAVLLSQLEQAPVLTPTETLSGERGKRKTTASKTPQRAKTAQTPKRKVADSTTQGKKPTKSKTSAKTPTVRQRKVRGA